VAPYEPQVAQWLRTVDRKRERLPAGA